MDSRVPTDYDTPLGRVQPKELAPSPLIEPKPYDPDKKYPPGQKPKSRTQLEQLFEDLGPQYDSTTGLKNRAETKPYKKPKENLKETYNEKNKVTWNYIVPVVLCKHLVNARPGLLAPTKIRKTIGGVLHHCAADAWGSNG